MCSTGRGGGGRTGFRACESSRQGVAATPTTSLWGSSQGMTSWWLQMGLVLVGRWESFQPGAGT